MKIEIQKADKPNKNNHVYPRATLEKIATDYTKNFVSERRAFICKNSPNSNDGGCMNLKDIVGLITEIKVEDNNLVAEVEPIPNIPDSLTMLNLLKEGLIFPVLSGIGTLKDMPDGTKQITNDYELVSVFLTNDPA